MQAAAAPASASNSAPTEPARDKKQNIHIVNHIYTHYPARLRKRTGNQNDIEEFSDKQPDSSVSFSESNTNSFEPDNDLKTLSLSQLENWFNSDSSETTRTSSNVKTERNSYNYKSSRQSTRIDSSLADETLDDDQLLEQLDSFDYDSSKLNNVTLTKFLDPRTSHSEKTVLLEKQELNKTDQEVVNELAAVQNVTTKILVKRAPGSTAEQRENPSSENDAEIQPETKQNPQTGVPAPQNSTAADQTKPNNTTAGNISTGNKTANKSLHEI